MGNNGERGYPGDTRPQMDDSFGYYPYNNGLPLWDEGVKADARKGCGNKQQDSGKDDRVPHEPCHQTDL